VVKLYDYALVLRSTHLITVVNANNILASD